MEKPASQSPALAYSRSDGDTARRERPGAKKTVVEKLRRFSVIANNIVVDCAPETEETMRQDIRDAMTAVCDCGA